LAAAGPVQEELLSSPGLLAALQSFLAQRGVAVDSLDAEPAVQLMLDWFRFQPIAPLDAAAATDVLVYRYGGWSEGCATGYKLSLLRRITMRAADGQETVAAAGITLLFDPGRFGGLPGYGTTSAEHASIEAFLGAIKGSSGYRLLSAARPMAVGLESGGLR
jgi:hypothetical protein